MKNIYSLIMGATLLALWIPFNYTIDDFTLYDTFRIEKTKPDQSQKPDKKARVLLSKSPLRVKRQGIAALMAPAIAATKTYSLTSDTGLTGASAGDELEYTIVITNSGDTDATGVAFSDLIDANTTLVTGSLKVSPVAQNDNYQTIGNVGLTIPQASGVLTNDVNPGNGTLVITTASPITTSQGGTVTLNTTTGAFTYEPAPGYTGGNDTFTYTLSNGSDLTSTATVTIAVSGKVWFVNNAATNSGTGTLSSPFKQMSDFSTANTGTSGKPGDNDYVFIFTGSGNYTGAATLRTGQKLIGQGATASLLAITGYTAPSGTNQLPSTGGVHPVLTTTSPGTNALTVGSGNTLRGFTIGNTTGSKIDGTNFGTLTVSEAVLTGSGQALNLTNGTLAATFTSITSNTSAAAGINLTNVSGNLTSNDGTTITNPTTQGINISTASSGTFNFGNTSITGSGSTGLASSGFANTLQFGTLTITPANGQKGIDISSGTGTLNVTTGSVTANGNSAISIAGTNTSNRIILGATFTSLSSTNSSATGISLSNVQGNLTSTTTTVTNPTGQGINVNNAVSGTFSFGTASITASGGTGLASSGFTNTLQFGSLTITPDAGQKGIDITGATGTLNIQASPQITTTNNTAISIAGLNVNSKVTLGINLTQVSANGSSGSTSKGISLTNTSGSFQITGSGSTAGSGGTIQNITLRGIEVINATNITLKNINLINANTSQSSVINAADYSSASAAVHLDNVNGVSLDNVDVSGTTVQRGLNAKTVQNLSMTNSDFINCGTEAQEGAMAFQDLSGTCSITNSTFRNSYEHAVNIINTSKNVTLVINNTTFEGTTFGSGLLVDSWGTSNTKVTVTNTSFTKIPSDAIKTINSETSIGNYEIANSTVDPTNPGTSPNDVGTVFEIASNGTSTVYINIHDNASLKGKGGSLINLAPAEQSTMHGKVHNNTVTYLPETTATTGRGIEVFGQDNAIGRFSITNNTVNNIPLSNGIDVNTRRGTTGTGRMDVTITGNTINMPQPVTATGYNIRLEAGNNSTSVNVVCGNVANNVIPSGGKGNNGHFRVSSFGTGSLLLEGAGANASNIWDNKSNNPTSANGAVISTRSGTNLQVGQTCLTPSNPPPGRIAAEETSEEVPASAALATTAASDSISTNPSDTVVASTIETAADSTPVKQDVASQQPPVRDPEPITQTNTSARTATTQAVEDVLVNGSGSGFTLPAGKSVTIKFKVTINSTIPAGTCQVSNQGRVSGSNISNVLTDDPGVGGSADPTVTPLISAPVITANQTNIITDPDAGVCTASESFAVTVAGCPAPTITYKIGNDVITSPHIFPSGTTTVNVTVSNGNAPDATSSFTVTVNPQAAPAINQEPVAKSVCAGSNATFSVTASGTGLSYKWQKKTGDGEFIDIPTAGNTSAATATLTLPAVTLSESGTQYRAIISNQCGGSTTSSAATLTVTPLPTATVSGTTTVCQGSTSPVITFTGASGTAPYTFTYRIGNGAEQTVSTEGTNTSVTVPQVTSTAGAFTYTLMSVKDALAGECTQPQTGSATITITPLPTATISGTITVCKESPNPGITFTGANGTAPYTFTYTINGEEKTITTTTGNSVKVVQETDEAGSFVYTLVSVADAGQCSQPQTGSATVTVTNPTEGGTVSGSAVVCKDANSGTLTLSGYTGNIIKWQSSTD
ncbi:beta strand repeat-containing protein, partial [Telluribacter humicola]